jgi:hypothetical protein
VRKLVLAAVAALLVPAATQAASLDFTGVGKAEVVTLYGVRNVTAYAGELDWTWLTGQPAGTPTSFYSYCVDVLNNETDPQNVTVRLTNDASAPAALTKAAWLFNTFAPAIHATGSNAMAAGLQLAIWEVLYDSTYNLGSGAFYVSASAQALSYGTQYLTALTNAGPGYSTAVAMWLDAERGAGQDQITSVPEPATLLLLGGGAALLGIRRRRATTGI